MGIMKKKGDMSMSFGMIFSIILIAVILVVGFIVITHFLNLKKCAEVGLFYNDLQEAIDRVWKSSSKTEQLNIILPGGIEEVCFVNFTQPMNNGDYASIKQRYGFYNPTLFLNPPEKACDMPYQVMKHINITRITERSNPQCIKNEEGKTIKISKDYYESLVSVG